MTVAGLAAGRASEGPSASAAGTSQWPGAARGPGASGKRGGPATRFGEAPERHRRRTKRLRPRWVDAVVTRKNARQPTVSVAIGRRRTARPDSTSTGSLPGRVTDPTGTVSRRSTPRLSACATASRSRTAIPAVVWSSPIAKSSARAPRVSRAWRGGGGAPSSERSTRACGHGPRPTQSVDGWR